jgi:hypothetical protein
MNSGGILLISSVITGWGSSRKQSMFHKTEQYASLQSNVFSLFRQRIMTYNTNMRAAAGPAFDYNF